MRLWVSRHQVAKKGIYYSALPGDQKYSSQDFRCLI